MQHHEDTMSETRSLINPTPFECSTCRKKFSRKDHLKRHQLQHSGSKPHQCVFCAATFTRSDNLKKHYPVCSQRNGQPIPEASKGGRRPHACDLCTSMKLGCDGESPCKPCQQKRLSCQYSRKEDRSTIQGLNVFKVPRLKEVSNVTNIKKGSIPINFLINVGTASFTEGMHWPFVNGIQQRSKPQLGVYSSEVTLTRLPLRNSSPNNEGLWFLDTGVNEQAIFENLNYLNQGFGGLHVPLTTSILTYSLELPNAQSAALIQALLGTAIIQSLARDEQILISQQLQQFFTPSGISRNVRLFFGLWHRLFPIIHEPSFQNEYATNSQLLSMVMIGALFSRDKKEIKTVHKLLDLVEAYIFSMDEFSDDFEIRQMLRPQFFRNASRRPWDDSTFSNIYAAAMIILAQFWAGTFVSRKRACSGRFDILIRAARRLGMFGSRHEADDCMDEQLWIKKESKLRLTYIIVIIDCTGLFFANIPCRFTISDLQFELPADTEIFISRHPFAKPNFVPRKDITVFEFYQSMFSASKDPSGLMQNEAWNLVTGNDMLIAIFLIYSRTHAHIQQISPLLSTQVPGANYSKLSDQFSSQPTLVEIKAALSRWITLWLKMRSEISHETWENLGLARNSDKFWLVAELLSSNPGSMNILTKMEVGCEDTLSQYKGLIRGNGKRS